jgi:hypothetical protein
MTKTKKVFITVKTYPSISKKYDELVCTAGILEDGSWVRIYPLPFRKLEYDNRYHKYQWMEIPLEKNRTDVRPESFQVTDLAKIKLLDKVGTRQGWKERREIVFRKETAFSDIKNLISRANNNELSLAIFKPTRIIDFIWEESSREWSKAKLDLLKSKAQQLSLFQTPEEVAKEFSVVKKLPYKFSYRFADAVGQETTLMIEDWEIGMLYWHCLEKSRNNEEEALQKVKQKYFIEFPKKDLYLFLGTTKKFHGWAKNPFVIIGIFYPPMKQQLSFL